MTKKEHRTALEAIAVILDSQYGLKEIAQKIRYIVKTMHNRPTRRLPRDKHGVSDDVLIQKAGGVAKLKAEWDAGLRYADLQRIYGIQNPRALSYAFTGKKK